MRYMYICIYVYIYKKNKKIKKLYIYVYMKTSLSNKLPVSRTVCNIHELAVQLWQYNARMVLDRLHLVCHGDF